MSKSSGNVGSISTTIRIPKYVYEKIEFEASSGDSHVSTIINNILRKYATWDRFVSDVGFMYMQKPLLRALFDKISDKDVVQVSKTIGYARTRDAILFIGGKVNVKTIVDVVKLWLTSSKVPIRIIENDESIKFIVQHNLGKKWSIYFVTLLKELFSELKITTIEEDIEDHTVEIIFALKTKKKKR
ncbi:MAG: hypothetical protein OEM28_11720 [Nitrosopumilus sp.]|nr:hypothetical protein [Nitrosopumilus sp.]MDH3488562.1 hypothetical protein [Nitrosopumilus sp.]